jgi:tryptophan halogenase
MGFRTEVDPLDSAATLGPAVRLRNDNLAQTRRMKADLPKHRDLIGKIVAHGLQTL